MKTIGMLGGISWQSTVSYYKALNEGVNNSLGGFHSAKICMVSVDFDEIEKLQQSGAWNEAAVMLSKAAQAVESGGADFVLICANTMHKVANEIGQHISIPILHIADATAKVLKADGMTRVGLLGTAYTMEQGFYKDRLANEHAIEVLVPESEERVIVHEVIFKELVQGTVSDNSRVEYLNIINSLHQRGADAVILGCTEIALLIQQHHTEVPVYDTTAIHAAEAVKQALDN